MILSRAILFFLLWFMAASCFRKHREYVYLFEDSTGNRYKWEQLPGLKNKDSFAVTKYYAIHFGKPTEIGDTQLQTFHFLYHRSPQVSDQYLNKALPGFSLFDINGSLFTSQMIRGKVAHINFWSPACTPCVTELDVFNRLAERYKNLVTFISIARESNDKLETFFKNHPLNFINLGNGGNYFDKLGFESVPNNFFVSRDGNIRYVSSGGPLDSEKAKDEIYQRYCFYLDSLLQ